MINVDCRSDGWVASGRSRESSVSAPGADREETGPLVWLRFAGDVTRPVPLDGLRWEYFADSVPWRRFRSRRGQAHLSGSYWAATTGGHVVHESRLELARLLLADFDPDVVGIHAQPCRLETRLAGRQRRHVPDFLLLSADATVTVVNVKPADRLADAKVAADLAWPGSLFTGHGWRYELWSGCDLVVLDNVRFLAGYRRREVVDDAAVDRAVAGVRDGEQLAVAEQRLAGSGPRWAPRPALLAGLWRGRLTTDLSRPLSGGSRLWRRTR